MELVTGDEGGLLKRVQVESPDGFGGVKSQQIVVAPFACGPQSRSKAVSRLAWCGTGDDRAALYTRFACATTYVCFQ